MENEHDFTTIKAKPVTLKKKYRFFNRHFLFLIFSYLVKYLIWLFIYWPIGHCYHRIKIKNRHYFRSLKSGAIIVCNHVHQLDAFYNGCIMLPANVYFTMLQSNLGIPFAGKLFRIAGGVPIPVDKGLMTSFTNGFADVLKKGKKVLVYPEAALKPYHDHIRDFKTGAFRWAVDFDVPVIPLVITFRKAKRATRKPYLTFTFLAPEYQSKLPSRYDTISELKNRVHQKMTNFFIQYKRLEGETNE